MSARMLLRRLHQLRPKFVGSHYPNVCVLSERYPLALIVEGITFAEIGVSGDVGEHVFQVFATFKRLSDHFEATQLIDRQGIKNCHGSCQFCIQPRQLTFKAIKRPRVQRQFHGVSRLGNHVLNDAEITALVRLSPLSFNVHGRFMRCLDLMGSKEERAEQGANSPDGLNPCGQLIAVSWEHTAPRRPILDRGDRRHHHNEQYSHCGYYEGDLSASFHVASRVDVSGCYSGGMSE